jgi:O-antigen/teichoic acid export membrane protein
MNGIRRALVLTTAERYIALIVNFASFAICSRLLTPSEIGLAVLGNVIGALLLSVREFATVAFIIQRKDLTTDDVRATFTAIAMLSIAASIVIALAAQTLAGFYDAPGLAKYLLVVSICITVEVVAQPVSGLLRRDMEFAKLACINISGTVIGGVLTIALALLGFSAMSFAWAWLATAIVVGTLSIAICADRSIYKPSIRGLGAVLTFGGYNGATALLYRVYDNLPYFALARILSVDALAMYNRALTICQLPDKLIVGGLTPVLMSAFSAEFRAGRPLRAAYLRSIELITAMQWPALALLAILADPVVRVLVGDQWLAAVPLVRIIAIASMFNFSAELNYPLLVAAGAMRDVFTRSLIVWPLSAGIITGAAFYGLEAAAFSWLVVVPLQAFVSITFVRRHVDVSWAEIGAALLRATIVSASSAAGPLAMILMLDGHFEHPLQMLIVAGVLGGVGWIAGLWAMGHPLLAEIRIAANALLAIPAARRASGT